MKTKINSTNWSRNCKTGGVFIVKRPFWFIITLWTLILGMCIFSALATGIKPAATNVIYEESPHYSGTVWVVNTDQREFSVKVYVDGEMGKYVTLKRSKLTFTIEDDALPIDFEVNLPNEVSPGKSTALIMIEETLDDSSSDGVSSRIILEHKITIEGPYPDKYVTTKLNFNKEGDKIIFVSEVENLGKKELDEVYTTFYVNNKKQKPLDTKTKSTALNLEENKLLIAEFNQSEFGSGEFEVSAITYYDGQKTKLLKKMLVGKPEVEVTYFDPYFVSNKINKYTLDLLNKWNARIENVFVDVVINKDNKEIDKFRTKSIDLEGEMSKRINDYFDAKDKAPGEYSFDLEVNFWNTYKMATQTYHSKLLTEEEFNLMKKEEVIKNLTTPQKLTGEAITPAGRPVTEKSSWWSSHKWTILSVMIGIISGIIITFISKKYTFTNRNNVKKDTKTKP